MMKSDWHIHSRNSCDEAALVVADLPAEAEAAGIRDFGLTDHLHTPYNLPDIAASRRDFLAADPSPRFHFGIEVSCVSQWELDQIATGRHERPVYGIRSGGPPNCPLAIGLTPDDAAALGIEFVVGGTHWPLYVAMERHAVIRDYHRQNTFLATHPLVDIVAHPWWWMGHWADADGSFRAEPWFDDFKAIPESMHDEFAAACVQHGTVVEMNLCAVLLNPQYPQRFILQYLDYLAELKSRKVSLCIGSDCHDPHYRMGFEAAARLLASVGIVDGDLWRLPPRAGMNGHEEN